MTVHRPAIQRQPAVHASGAGWVLVVILGVLVLTASLLIAFPPRAADTGTTSPQVAAYRLRAERIDIEPYAVKPFSPFSLIAYPSGFTPTYNPLLGNGLISYPSGFTATYSPLAHLTIMINYPSGFTATYNPLNTVYRP